LATNYTNNEGKTLSFEDIKKEAECWRYAFNCVKKAYHKEMESFALQCLQTYNMWLECIWGEMYSPEELLNLLKEA